MSTSNSNQNNGNSNKVSWTLLAIFAIVVIAIESFSLGKALQSRPQSDTGLSPDVTGTNISVDYSEPETTEVSTESSVESEVKSYIVDNGNELTSEILIDIGSTLVQLKVPESHNCFNKEYLTQLQTQYSLDNLIVDNLLVTGDADAKASLFESTEIVVAAPISTTKEIFKEIYKDDYDENAVYSAVYSYMITGEVPESDRANYSIEELDPIGNGLIWRVFDESYTLEIEGQEDIEDVHNLYAYSQTENSIEIIINSGSLERSLELLNEVINVK